MYWTQGDFTGDFAVDVNDLAIVLSNFGSTVGAAMNGVPEPPAVALLLAAALAPLAFRRRQRNRHTPCAESDAGYG